MNQIKELKGYSTEIIYKKNKNNESMPILEITLNLYCDNNKGIKKGICFKAFTNLIEIFNGDNENPPCDNDEIQFYIPLEKFSGPQIFGGDIKIYFNNTNSSILMLKYKVIIDEFIRYGNTPHDVLYVRNFEINYK